ncbi:MEDS domain-containing protein [Saccharothrix isguenensis]
MSFADDAEQRTTVTEYLSTGLAAGDRVLYFADRQSPSTVLGWLTSTGVDTGSALLDGQLRVVTAEDSYLAAGRFTPAAMIATLRQEVDDSLVSGFRGLRVCGEMSWALRGVTGSERLEDYEREVDEVFTGRPMSAICQYDARLFPTDRLETFQHCHRGSVEPAPLHSDSLLRVIPAVRSGARCLRVIGTVDQRTNHHLARVLDAAVDGSGDLVVDVSATEFIDIAGVRALADTAARLGGDRTLRVEHLAPALREVFRLVGWDRTPGLVLVTEGTTA